MKLTEQELRRSRFSYFLGKVVTVLTNAPVLPYGGDEQTMLLHFKTYGGVCEGFDELGVWLMDTQTKAKSFFFYRDIQGLVENPALAADHPLVQEALQKVQQTKEIKTVINKGKEVMESLGDLTVENFAEVLKTQLASK